jgi:TusA-related sulfurtransferase
MKKESLQVHGSVDIRAHVCPMTWVRVKLALEALEPGQVLQVHLRGEEPLRNVPRAAELEGHALLAQEVHGDDAQLLLRKGG